MKGSGYEGGNPEKPGPAFSFFRKGDKRISGAVGTYTVLTMLNEVMRLAAKSTKSLPLNPVKFLKLTGIGAGTGILLTICILLLLSLVMSARDIPHAFVGPMAVTAMAVGSLAAGYLSSRLLGEKGLLAGAAAGGIIFLIAALSGLAVGSFCLGFQAALRLITILLAAAVGGVAGVNAKKKRKR